MLCLILIVHYLFIYILMDLLGERITNFPQIMACFITIKHFQI